MRREMIEPPPGTPFGRTAFSAANPDGNAAFLLSAKIYVFVYIVVNDGVLPLCAFAYRQARLFIFHRNADKLSRRGLPRCRSPPFPICF